MQQALCEQPYASRLAKKQNANGEATTSDSNNAITNYTIAACCSDHFRRKIKRSTTAIAVCSWTVP